MLNRILVVALASIFLGACDPGALSAKPSKGTDALSPPDAGRKGRGKKSEPPRVERPKDEPLSSILESTAAEKRLPRCKRIGPNDWAHRWGAFDAGDGDLTMDDLRYLHSHYGLGMYSYKDVRRQVTRASKGQAMSDEVIEPRALKRMGLIVIQTANSHNLPFTETSFYFNRTKVRNYAAKMASEPFNDAIGYNAEDGADACGERGDPSDTCVEPIKDVAPDSNRDLALDDDGNGVITRVERAPSVIVDLKRGAELHGKPLVVVTHQKPNFGKHGLNAKQLAKHADLLQVWEFKGRPTPVIQGIKQIRSNWKAALETGEGERYPNYPVDFVVDWGRGDLAYLDGASLAAARSIAPKLLDAGIRNVTVFNTKPAIDCVRDVSKCLVRKGNKVQSVLRYTADGPADKIDSRDEEQLDENGKSLEPRVFRHLTGVSPKEMQDHLKAFFANLKKHYGQRPVQPCEP